MNMRSIYIGVALFFVLAITLFVTSFICLDKAKHKTYYYTINLSGHDIGAIRVDKFITEDKLVYKSVVETPFFPVFTEYRSRLDLSKKWALENYTKEKQAGRNTDLLYLENKGGLVSFVSRYQSRFACVDNIPVKKDVFVFDEESPMTFMPILENYNFSRGRSQGFNTLACPAEPDLPPLKKFITLTSIKNEYLKIDKRKIKAENLILKSRNHPQGSIWVSLSDRSLLRIELPAKGIVITRSFKPRPVSAKEMSVENTGYSSKEIIFKNKSTELYGTLTVPEKEGRVPAVLLLCGGSSSTRECQGLFTFISDHLSKNGFCVLRFDRRGLGSSKQDAPAVTDEDDSADAYAAIDYLSSLGIIDPKKIAIIGHDKGALFALNTAARCGDGVKALILMAPSVAVEKSPAEKAKELGKIAAQSNWSEDYLNLCMRSIQETDEKVKNSTGNWVSVLGKRCYVKNMRGETPPALKEIAGKIKSHVLILQGQDDSEMSRETASELDKALAAAGNTDHTLTYYGYLGHFFGKKINDGTHRIYYDTDKDVLGNIQQWLDKALVEQVASPTAIALPAGEKSGPEQPKTASPATSSAQK